MTTPTPKTKTPRKAPRRAPAPARSKGETRVTPAKRRTTAYPPKVRETALDVIRDQGIAAAHAATKVPKATLSRWAKAAGIELEPAARARTRGAAAAVVEAATRARLTTTQLLEEHIAEAGAYLLTVAQRNATAAELIAALDPQLIKLEPTLGGTVVVLDDDAAHAAQKQAQALATLPLAPRDAEGILTRAIHDLQLLRGEATERGELVVEFDIPRPRPGAVEPVIRPALED